MIYEVGFFPLMALQHDHRGRADGGELPNILAKVSDFYDMEVVYALEAFLALLEPVMIAGMGLLVCFILLAVFLPPLPVHHECRLDDGPRAGASARAPDPPRQTALYNTCVEPVAGVPGSMRILLDHACRQVMEYAAPVLGPGGVRVLSWGLLRGTRWLCLPGRARGGPERMGW